MGANAVDNSNLLQMCKDCGAVGFVPTVTYAYDAGAATVAITNSSTIPAGDALKRVKFAVHDCFGNQVTGHIDVAAGGAGYVTAPTVVIGGPGTGAVAHAVLTGDRVSSVVVDTPGTGYSSAPAISFTGGGGSGAAATATVGSGAVTAIAVTAASSTVTVSVSTLNRSKPLAISVTILTDLMIAADGGAYGLMAAGDIGFWDIQKNA